MAAKLNKDQILNKKIVDYTFVIAFFFIFSFFIFFAIKPNLETAFKLQKELEELKQVDANYNEAIKTIISIQSSIEDNRDSLHLLDEALPAKPEVNKILSDIQKTASESGFPINKLNVAEIPIINPVRDKNIKSFKVTFTSASNFDTSQQFIFNLLLQRRLKKIDKIVFDKAPSVSSESAKLNISFEVESFYL